MIRYRYAINEKDELIDVNNLIRGSSNKFFSLDTQQELIPRLGNIRQKHFSHKSNSHNQGSQETYLHALGKRVFYDRYTKCLEQGTPYYFHYDVQYSCDRLMLEHQKICSYLTKKSVNLCDRFSEIRWEKVDGEFIPDILLFDPIKQIKIYVEIAVTHTSSKQKIDSGFRIIEFHIKSEEDIQTIQQFGNLEYQQNASIKLYNFKTHQKYEKCPPKQCRQNFYFFSVDQFGRGVINDCKESQIYIVKHMFPFTSMKPKTRDSNRKEYTDMFKNFVKEAYNANTIIKDCFLCRYHAEKESSRKNAIFCKYLKIDCSSDYAAECSAYRIDLKDTI